MRWNTDMRCPAVVPPCFHFFLAGFCRAEIPAINFGKSIGCRSRGAPTPFPAQLSFSSKEPPFGKCPKDRFGDFCKRAPVSFSAKEPPFRKCQKDRFGDFCKCLGLLQRTPFFCLLQTLVAFAENVGWAVFTSNVCDICRNYSSSPLSRYFRSLWYLQKPPRSSFGHLQKL